MASNNVNILKVVLDNNILTFKSSTLYCIIYATVPSNEVQLNRSVIVMNYILW